MVCYHLNTFKQGKNTEFMYKISSKNKQFDSLNTELKKWIKKENRIK